MCKELAMILQSKHVWINEQFQPAQLEIENGKILNIYPYGFKEVTDDFDEYKVLPGLIDMHCHGFNGMDCNYVHREGFIHWMNSLPKEGVTSFLATTSTAPEENLLQSFACIKKTITEYNEGAHCLGIHVEGPQISFDFKGAHNPYFIQKPSVEQFERYQDAASNIIKLICIAPEMDVNHTLIKYCKNKGIKVTIGHTGATYNECVLAAKDGAGSFTHTFNGMLGIHHREPGTAGAAMAMDDMYAELICDGVHIHYAVAKVVAKTKGKDRLILITDAVQIKGLKPGIYETPNRWVEVKEDGCGRLKDGRLAGSSNKMITMLKNCIQECGIDEVTAINAATKNPATFLDLADKGVLEKGKDADILIIDNCFEVIQTYCRGKAYL